MQIAITTYDSEGQPRTVKFAPRQAAAEKPLTIRFFQALTLLSRASSFMADTVSTPPGGPTPEFNSAFLQIYLDTDAMRKLEANPAHFAVILAKFMPKAPANVADTIRKDC